MICAIMKTESYFKTTYVSHAGASGLMQVMPDVWHDIMQLYGAELQYTENVFDPANNIEVACAYLAWLRYDFLPRHFADFDPAPDAPPAVVRDTAAAPRQTPRILVNAPEPMVAIAYKMTVASVAQAVTGEFENKGFIG